MKFKDPITGEYKTLYLKTSDTLPVGTIVSFEGDEIPEGYEEVIGEEARVVISPTEPTTGEEVWIQKGKNLLNLLKCQISNASSNYNIDNANKITVNSTWGWGHVQIDDFEVIVGKEYVISCDFTNSLNINTGIIIYNDNGDTLNYQSFVATNGNLEIRFTPNTEKIKIKFACNNTPDNYNNTVVYDNIQIEFNNKTPFEPYIDKKIHTKNDNDVYEVFYDETNLEVYSTQETRVGTWIDGKPLYRKIITYTTTAGGEHNISISDINFDYIELKTFSVKTDNYVLNIYGTDGGNDRIRSFINTKDKNIVYQNGSAWANSTYYGTIEYTKK